MYAGINKDVFWGDQSPSLWGIDPPQTEGVPSTILLYAQYNNNFYNGWPPEKFSVVLDMRRADTALTQA